MYGLHSTIIIPNMPIQEDSQATTVAATESQAQILFGAFHVGASNLGKQVDGPHTHATCRCQKSYGIQIWISRPMKILG